MAKTQAVTILFCDLVASTERRARLGDDAYDEFSRQLFVTLRDAIARAGGREVSSAGDGMMIVFPDSVADAVSCAIEMHRAVVELDLDDPPRLRIGISCGEVAQDGDQYSGMPIIEAARLEAAAALPVPDDAASVVWSIAAVHHWTDVDAGLREATRVLRSGGHLVAIERRTLPGARGHASHGWTDAQADAFADRCREHGLADVQVGRNASGRRSTVSVTASAH